MTGGSMAGRLAIAAAVALAVLGAASVRLVGEGRAALAASDAALARRDVMAAVVEARRAAGAYVPFASHTEQGLLKLSDIAQKSERRGDTETALFAWRALLSAATGTRPFSSASDKARADAEASVARLSSEILTSARAGSGAKREPGAESSLAAADLVPRIGWSALLLAGAGLWWGAGARLTSRGWGSDGRLVSREVRIAAGLGLVGLFAWLVGLLLL